MHQWQRDWLDALLAIEVTPMLDLSAHTELLRRAMTLTLTEHDRERVIAAIGKASALLTQVRDTQPTIPTLDRELREFLGVGRECHLTCKSGLWRCLLWVDADYYEGEGETMVEAVDGALRHARGGT